ncbi:MAG: helix-turn-helix transcriptional regulator [Dethiobacter sp.]|nr:helix-turn-helix transcriptional regulator [Dethiobacter sp.]
MEFNARQQAILEIVKHDGPISGEEIAARLNLSRAALRPHLAVLTMSGAIDARPRVGYFYAGRNTSDLLGDILRGITVGDIKSRPIMIREHTSVYDAIVTLFLEDVGTLFVVDESGLLQGVVSRKDFIKIALGGANLNKIPVGVIMTRLPSLHMITEEETMLDVARRIMEYEVDSLPVVRLTEEKNFKVVGRVTKTNLARLLVELAEGR